MFAAGSCLLPALLLLVRAPTPTLRGAAPAGERSPVDVLLTPDERYLISINQGSGTIALVDLSTARVVSEVACGARPGAAVLTPNGRRLLVSATFAGKITLFDIADGTLKPAGAIPVGFAPRGLAVAPDGKLAYVALSNGSAVAVLDLEQNKLVDKIEVGRWPRYLALSPDGKKLAVGVNGDGGVAVVDTATRKRAFLEDFAGINLGQMQVAADNRFVYFPFMVYRHNPITAGNIRLGWVLASRIGRVRLDKQLRREAVSLDPQGQAIADPHGLALSPDEQTLVCAASGTQELLVYRLKDLPLQDYGGSDHIPPDLLKDRQRFRRIALGGRPMALRFARDGQRVFVANYLLNAIQVVDLSTDKIAQTIHLGGPKEPSLARRGEAIFYDGKRSLDQWYSCHSCHYEGGTNAIAMDTRNDGRDRTFKTVLPLRHVGKTGPWFWHGWQTDLDAAVRKSMTETMLGKEPTADDVRAVIAFLNELDVPPNPYRQADGTLTEPARRGEKVFQRAGCANCHSGPYFTDGKIHDVGLGGRNDAYQGYNPPSLLGVHDRVKFLHDGRASSLREVLTGPHSPARLSDTTLSAEELDDLIAYLKSL
ncbi:MAG: beta-propeller fold lactonase family protein [Gemmataceae bacterium]